MYGKSNWQTSKEGQELFAENESDSNILKFDPYAVAWKIKFAYKIAPIVVGHIPKEISRYVHLFLIHGGTATAITCSGKYYPSPIPKGGLEILLTRLKELIEANYKEPLMNLAGSIDVHRYCKNDQNVADGFQGVIIINDDEINSEERRGQCIIYKKTSVRGQFP